MTQSTTFFIFFSIFETYQYFLAVWHLFNLVVTKVSRQTRDPTMQILLQHDKRHSKTSVKKIRCPRYRIGTICNVRIRIVPRPPQQFYTCKENFFKPVSNTVLCLLESCGYRKDNKKRNALIKITLRIITDYIRCRLILTYP